jgi:hypothetical protein
LKFNVLKSLKENVGRVLTGLSRLRLGISGRPLMNKVINLQFTQKTENVMTLRIT